MTPELVLFGHDVVQVASAIELALRVHRRNGHAPDDRLRGLAAKVATAAPLVAVCLPALLDVAGPQAAAAVRAEASGTAASATASRSVSLASSEAARLAGVSGQAIRAACISGRLVARKSQITGEWQIDPADLAGWMEARNAA